jgi:hypothetical protein
MDIRLAVKDVILMFMSDSNRFIAAVEVNSGLFVGAGCPRLRKAHAM